MKRLAPILALVAVVGAGCARGGDDGGAQAAPRPLCPKEFRAEWQHLANDIGVAVFCPSWLPTGLTAELGHHSEADPDGSYQAGFHDPELRSAEVHVVLSAYPHKSRPPRCEDLKTNKIGSCWLEPSGRKRVGRHEVTVYERGVGHESRHLVYGWMYRGTLYGASIHIDPRLGLWRARRDLDRIVSGLERIEPHSGAHGHTGTDAEHDH